MADSESLKTLEKLNSADRQRLEEYTDSFSSLNIGSDFTSPAFPKGNPHKPLLLLSVIKLLADQKVRENEFQFSRELENEFDALWKIAAPDSQPGQAKTPFEHLGSEDFWHLKTDTNKGKIAYLDESLFQLLQDRYLRELLTGILVRIYFADNRKRELLMHLGTSEEAYQDSSRYERSISAARIRDVSRDELIKAMEAFDNKLRPTDEWKNWTETKLNKYKYAINYNERLYPVKKIISLATGTPVASFSGGAEANSYVQKRGFEILEIRKNENAMNIKEALHQILSTYPQIAKGRFQKEQIREPYNNMKRAIWSSLSPETIHHLKIEWSVGKGNWADIPWMAFLDTRETNTIQKGIYVVILFRKDMTGAYLTLAQGVTEEWNQLGTAKTRELLAERVKVLRSQYGEQLRDRLTLDEEIDLRGSRDLGKLYEASSVAYKFYDKESLPNDDEILEDLKSALAVYNQYVTSKTHPTEGPPPTIDMNDLIANLIARIDQTSFVFEPWQIATYIAALRTKPFLILAGVTGTGKSKLPALIANCTGGRHKTIPVRPDWTDSSELLGYVDLKQRFHPGPVLELAREAADNPTLHYTCIIDEMNLARVEQYFAEVLSCIENRSPLPDGGYSSATLLSIRLPDSELKWLDVRLPANMGLVGTVNMDESAHGFSRKVLDRAFTIEMSDIQLAQWKTKENLSSAIEEWPNNVFYPRAIQLGELRDITAKQEELIDEVIEVLEDANKILQIAQLQVGYRSRDEIALFLINANETLKHFRTHLNESVSPLDVAIMMKILPRIIGGNAPVRQVVFRLLGWSIGTDITDEDGARVHVEKWENDGRPSAFGDRFPRTAARLLLMADRLLNEGFTSYWL